MLDWLSVTLGNFQGGIVRSLATELHAGGMSSAALAFVLGAVHALTPGHGKAALAAYFLGTEAHICKGLRVALSAALLHVITGFAVFLVLRFLIGQAPSITSRGPPSFTLLGYGLIIIAGILMLAQAVRPSHRAHNSAGALTAGIGLLPCPLTISVLGFAWAQGTAAMVGLVLLSLTLGITTTIGLVALLAIATRASMGAAFARHLPQFKRNARILQAVTAVAIVGIGAYTLASALAF